MVDVVLRPNATEVRIGEKGDKLWHLTMTYWAGGGENGKREIDYGI